MRNGLLTVTALVAALAAAGLQAKGTINPDRGSVSVTTISGTPLIINVGADQAFQVYNTEISAGTLGQIYPQGATLADMGWFIDTGGALTAPAFGDHPSGTATSSIGTFSTYAYRSVSAVGGNGSAATPFSVTVTGETAQFDVSQVVSYVNGDNFFRKSFTLTNTTGGTVGARVFLGSDIYLANSDDGTPYREPNSGSPGGRTCAGVTPEYTILHIPQGSVAPSGFSADGYDSIWTQIGAAALNNTVNPAACTDNGAALQWDINVPAGASVTLQAATSFGAIPTIIGGSQNAVPAPAIGTWGLAALALALLALAGVALTRRS
ncbi:MAG: hypothetical protein IT479_02505 [Xanthomonadales bacterium]|nr:hypothetical protein [Xanthomonadales bacterium]MCC6592120.1 hypothetical protein [Xanthomonadales bacterium]MCE7932531.1 hypothetical protein [Xanthomonadales bacterium PRO6]